MLSRTCLALLAALCCAACAETEVARDELRAVVDRDIVRFSNEQLPEELLARVARSQVVVFGEYHQNSDHYALLSALVVALHRRGVRQLLLEWPHAWDWELIAAVEEGRNPGWTARFEKIGGVVVDAIGRLNRTLPAGERMRVRAIDVNHAGYGGAAGFAQAFRGLAEHLPEGAWLSERLATYDAQPDERRIHALEALRDDLVRERSRRAALWGDVWVERVIETIEIELLSIPIRARWESDENLATDLREDVMKRLCDMRLREVAGKTVVNVGVSHAQKAMLFNGTRQEWLGDYLVHRSPAGAGVTETVALVPARGEVYVTGTISSIDIEKSSPPNELLRVMDEAASGQTAFLALDDPLFAREAILVSSLSDVRVCAPKRHFDAYVLLPEAHVYRSSSPGAARGAGD